MAARSRLTAQTIEQIAAVVRAGATIAVAASVAGVSERTIYGWLERGDLERTAKRDARHRELRQAVERARAEREAALVAKINFAATRGSWKASAWLLERRYPERWAARTPGAIHALDDDGAWAIIDDQLGPDGQPL